jgi:chromosome segregation ATPase
MPYAGERVRVTAIRDVTSYVEAHETLVRAQHELERRVEERTHELARLNEALIEKLSELELFERAVVGRELKMIELEQEIATLRQRLRNVP